MTLPNTSRHIRTDQETSRRERRRGQRALRDLAVLFALAVLSFALAAHFDFHEDLERWNSSYEQTDEMIVTLCVLSVGFGFFSWRRWRELKGEIAEREQAEAGLRRSEERYRTFIETALEGVYTIDTEGRITYANGRMAEMLGYPVQEMVGRQSLDFMDEAGRAQARENLERRTQGVAETIEFRFVRKDGSDLWTLIATRPLMDENGRYAGAFGMITDITERKRAEEERVRLSRAVEQAAESIMITEPDGTIVYVNPAFERVSGYSRAEAIGQNPRILKSGNQDAAFYRGMWDTLQRGEAWSGRFTNRRKDGSLYEEEVVISPMHDASGKVVNYVAAKRDVTQEVALEAQLRQAQKMEAVGTLAGGIAHDFNNLLTTIIGFAQLALMEKDLKPGVRGYIDRIPIQGKRAAQLISQLLTFSRKAITERQPMSLTPLVKETVKMLERTVPENIKIRMSVSKEAAPVNADPTQIQQVIMNLCINASQAMPYGGELTVGLEDAMLDDAYCRQHAYVRPGSHVRLSVRDTGMGMTPEVQARIFEPFFTTKGVGEGTGLGLATVYGIVKGHEGHVNVYSEVGRGSEFKVYLPAIEEAAPSRVVAAEEPPSGGTETLLLVEDEATVRDAGQAILEHLGYTVLTAGDGEEALEVYGARREEIALVLTDMVMPGMGGEALYEALVEAKPGVRVVLMSGYSLQEAVADLRARGLKGFVQKPLDFYKLGRMVRQALDA